MFEIDDVLVSRDVAECWFCCDVGRCHGQCCVEGDAGAPITPSEAMSLEAALPGIRQELSPAARRVIASQGVAYLDRDGDLVTSIVDDRDCVFTCYAPGGVCQCAVERGWERAGRPHGRMRKPLSCALAPLRVGYYPDGRRVVNYERWDVCRGAEALGRRLGLRLYQFLEGPLRQCFGDGWYTELSQVCQEWNRQRATAKGTE